MKQLNKLLLLAIILLFGCFASEAAIKVKTVKGQVMIVKGGKEVALKVGEVVMPGSEVVIPQGGVLEVLNDISNTIYTSTSAGRMKLSRMMLDARESSKDNFSSVNRQLTLGKGGANRDKRVYVEKGMVKRSLSEYDPEAGSVELDVATLASYLNRVISGAKGKNLPVEVSSSRTDTVGMQFRVKNTLNFPLYFNVIKVKENNGLKVVEISEVGQPTGSYVIQPNQALSRQHYPAIEPGVRHILVASHCHYDIDKLLELLNAPSSIGDMPEMDLPLYIQEM